MLHSLPLGFGVDGAIEDTVFILTKRSQIAYNLLQLHRLTVVKTVIKGETSTMALAQDLNIERNTRLNHHFFGKISHLVAALWQRLWWHTKGYTTVLSIMFLVLASLSFLSVHWWRKKLTQVFQQEAVLEQE